MEVLVSGKGLTRAEVVQVARHGAIASLSEEARTRIGASRVRVEALADSEVPAYGISTGFGALATVFISADKRTDLQRALIRSHAAGVGPAVEPEVVRATMLLRLRTLAMGFSGVRIELAEQLEGLLASGVTPVVPEFGSLGCSGDLAPLAHIALVLLGEGRALSARRERSRRRRRSGLCQSPTARAGLQGGVSPHQRNRRDAWLSWCWPSPTPSGC